MTAADKLRELLATRPAQPGLVELVRWWQTSGVLVPQLLADLEGVECDLAAERARHRANVEGFESALAQEAHEKDVLEQVGCGLLEDKRLLRGELLRVKAELAALPGRDQDPVARVDDESRCAVCGWKLGKSWTMGSSTFVCVRGSCGHRPFLVNLYAPARAEREAAELSDRAQRERMEAGHA